MNRPTPRTLAAATAVASIVAGAVYAQSPFTQIMRYRQTEATTARFDAQRTGWIRLDHFIAPDKMNGFALQWKTKLANTGGKEAALSGGIVAGAGLGITLAWLGASGNRTIGIDMDNGHAFFNRTYGNNAPAATGGCLSASLATPTQATPLTPPVPGPPTMAGQAAVGPNSQLPYSSVIGAPGEGVPAVKPGAYFSTPGSYFGATGAQPYDGTPASAVAGAAYAATGSGGNLFGRGGAGRGAGGFGGGGGRGGSNVSYALSNDGMLHGLTLHDGLDGIQPIPFLPAGAQATDLIMINGVVYTSTVNGCGGAPNAVWAITPAATPAGGTFPKANSWTTGGTASPHAVAFNADGLMFVSVGAGTGEFASSVVSLDPASLTVKSKFTLAGANFATPASILRLDNRDIVSVQAADGRVFLLDGADLSTSLYASAAVANRGAYKPSKPYEPAGLAVGQDSGGQAWLLSTTPTSVVAYKIALNGGSASLTPAWTLGGLKSPLAPLVVNGVVFAVSTGDTTPAILYAVNGITGQKLWDSGKTIATPVPHSSALWNSMGQILVGGSDSTLYAFGVNMERHL